MNKLLSNRMIWLLVGTTLMALGIELIVLANCGCDSISTLIVGVMHHSTIPFGRWSQIISSIMIIIALIFDRKLLGAGSVVNGLLLGQMILVFDSFLINISIPIYPLFLSLIGYIIMSGGTALYLHAHLGAGPMECIMLLLNKNFGFSIKKSRIIIDFSLTVIGILLGGTYGVGTLFAVFLLGQLIELFTRLFDTILV